VGSSSKAKVTTNGISVVNGSDTGATVYWTNGKTTIVSFSYASITNACPTYLGVTATYEEQETATVTAEPQDSRRCLPHLRMYASTSTPRSPWSRMFAHPVS